MTGWRTRGRRGATAESSVGGDRLGRAEQRVDPLEVGVGLTDGAAHLGDDREGLAPDLLDGLSAGSSASRGQLHDRPDQHHERPCRLATATITAAVSLVSIVVPSRAVFVADLVAKASHALGDLLFEAVVDGV